MTIDFRNFPKISKTSLQGVLGCAIAVVVAVSSLPTGAKWGVIALGALRAIVGFLQQDADLLRAGQPGNPTNKDLDATPVPLEPQP